MYWYHIYISYEVCTCSSTWCWRLRDSDSEWTDCEYTQDQHILYIHTVHTYMYVQYIVVHMHISCLYNICMMYIYTHATLQFTSSLFELEL